MKRVTQIIRAAANTIMQSESGYRIFKEFNLHTDCAIWIAYTLQESGFSPDDRNLTADAAVAVCQTHWPALVNRAMMRPEWTPVVKQLIQAIGGEGYYVDSTS